MNHSIVILKPSHWRQAGLSRFPLINPNARDWTIQVKYKLSIHWCVCVQLRLAIIENVKSQLNHENLSLIETEFTCSLLKEIH